MCFYIIIIVIECVLYSNPRVNFSIEEVNTAILLGGEQPNFPSRDLVPTSSPTTARTSTSTTTTTTRTTMTSSATPKPRPSPIPVRNKSPSKKDFLEIIRNFKYM